MTPQDKKAATAEKDTPVNEPGPLDNAIQDVVRDGKKLLNTICNIEKTLNQEAHKHLDEHTHEWLEKIRQHPVKSILIAGGIGFALSALRKRK